VEGLGGLGAGEKGPGFKVHKKKKGGGGRAKVWGTRSKVQEKGKGGGKEIKMCRRGFSCCFRGSVPLGMQAPGGVTGGKERKFVLKPKKKGKQGGTVTDLSLRGTMGEPSKKEKKNKKEDGETQNPGREKSRSLW